MIKSLLNLIFPPLCLNCQNGLHDHTILCTACLGLLELIDPSQRCPLCFVENSGVCPDCRRDPPPLAGAASALDYVGPAAALIKRVKYHNQPYLVSGLAGYLVTQFLQLEWPMPDLIVPVPMSRLKKFFRGYNQSLLLAQAVGELLQRPVAQSLLRSSGDYSQAGLSLDQRRQLAGDRFKLADSHNLRDKRILLIDDVATSGATLRKCGELLLSAAPMTIYALTVCRAMR